MPNRVVDFLVRALATADVRHVFGVDGANIEDLYDAFGDSEITGVIAKHEFSAAAMADGCARTTGRLGVVAATSGGGAMNLVAGLAESYASRVPVLALIGQPPTSMEGHGAFQDTSGRSGTIDALCLFGSITRYCARIDHVDDVPDELARAITATRSGGPAALLLPKDIQQSAFRDHPPSQPSDYEITCVKADLGKVQALLANAHRTGKVVIVAGDQVARDDARAALARLATALDATVGVAPDAKDTYDNTAPEFAGVAGSMGHQQLVAAIRTARLCLLVGTTMPITARAGLADTLAAVPVAGIGHTPPHVPAVHAVSTDLAVTLNDLATEFGHTLRTPTTESSRIPPTPLPVPLSTGPGLRYHSLLECISRALPPDTDVFADAGNTGAAAVHHLCVPQGGRFVIALGMGGMGYAFGAGIGSAFGCHSLRRTVIIAGDGAFYMHGMEIHTAIEHHLPIVFIVLNNNAHAMCVARERLFYRNSHSRNLFRTTYLGDGIGAMFPGLPAHTARTTAELTTALADCLSTPGPSFLEIICDPDEIPPFIPFLTGQPQPSIPPRRTP